MTDFEICGNKVLPGETKTLHLNLPRLYDFTEVGIPVRVIRGKTDGPVLFISAAIHGDEINGLEIIKRIQKQKSLKKLSGTLICIPIVNVFGFQNKSRYLPDRRDLNRSFPGNKSGSMAQRIANIFMEEVVSKCTHGIDLHTGAIHRTNLPQIRAEISDKETKRLANAFGAPVILNSSLRDGSLREAVREMNLPVLLYEGGEALRFDDWAIKIGVKGILNVMREIGMLPKVSNEKTTSQKKKLLKSPTLALGSYWVRASISGTVMRKKKIGDSVEEGDVLGAISDPFGDNRTEVLAKTSGIIIGENLIPMVNQGEALFHIATFKNIDFVEDTIDEMVDFFNE